MRKNHFAIWSVLGAVLALSSPSAQATTACGKLSITLKQTRLSNGEKGEWQIACFGGSLADCKAACLSVYQSLESDAAERNADLKYLAKKEQDAENEKKAEENRKAQRSANKDEHLSDMAITDKTKTIKKTEGLVNAANLANQGAQFVGSNAVNLIGQAKSSNLNMNSKMSDTLKAARDTTQTAQMVSGAAATVNTVFMMTQQARIKLHQQQLKALSDCTPNGKLVKCSDLVLQEDLNKALPTSGYDNSPAAYLNKLKIEQSRAIQTAIAGRNTSGLKAAEQLANVGATGLAIKKQNENIAEAKKGETMQTQLGVSGQMITMNGVTGVDQQPATAQPTGDPQTAEDDGTGDAPMVNLGDPSNPFGGDMEAQGPVAGQFKPGATGPTGGGGGGGTPNVGGGGAPPAGGGEEQKAQYVANFEGRDRYETGGSVARGGAGGKGGAAAGGSDGGLDFNSLLAQFLPKADGGDTMNDQGILEYGAGRAPAAEAPAPSYLDKNADIFQRIHQTYQEKQGRGHVGI